MFSLNTWSSLHDQFKMEGFIITCKYFLQICLVVLCKLLDAFYRNLNFKKKKLNINFSSL